MGIFLIWVTCLIEAFFTAWNYLISNTVFKRDTLKIYYIFFSNLYTSSCMNIRSICSIKSVNSFVYLEVADTNKSYQHSEIQNKNNNLYFICGFELSPPLEGLFFIFIGVVLWTIGGFALLLCIREKVFRTKIILFFVAVMFFVLWWHITSIGLEIISTN